MKENTSCSTLDTYKEKPVFITVEITEDSVKLVVRKLSGISSPGGTDTDNLQEWLLKIGDDSKIFLSSSETFNDWLDNKSLPWA